MDVAQFLDFMLGSKSAVANKPLEETRKSLLDDAQKDLRDVIEKNLPVIYLVKGDNVVTNLITALNTMDIEELVDFVDSVTDKKQGKLYPTQDEFWDYLDSKQKILDKEIPKISRKIIKEIASTITKEITFKSLNSNVEKINVSLNSASNAYAAAISMGTSKDINQVTEWLRKQVIKAGEDLRTYLNANTPAVFTDAKQILSSYNNSTEILIVGSTFKYIKGRVNDIATPIVRDWLVSHGIDVSSKMTVGRFTDAGHVAVVSQEKEVQEIVGINTPLTQMVLAYASQQAKSNVTMDTFILNSTHIDCALSIKKEISTFKNLLSLNFSFVVSQESNFNQNILRTAENAAMNTLIQNVFNTTRKKLKEDFLKRIVSGKGLDYLVSALRFSPTLQESITLQVIAALKGEKDSQFLAMGNAKQIGKSSGFSTIKKDIQKAITKINNSDGPSNSVSKRSKRAPKTDSLLDLQALINTHLQSTISANMGDGTARNILNYRTGRLAASASVTKLSKSREGMITAFYEYMKNPYQTFEPGYRQGSPKTRDPKLLIATSIREIAAIKVNNRLRAVSV
jgi:hypothetical protein